MSEPVGWLRALVFDAEDSERLAAFWQAVLGVGVADVQDGWLQLGPDQGGVYVAFETTDGTATAATKAAPGFRPDIEVEDMDVAQARIEELGGRLVKIVHANEHESHRRMADPEGNEFTIVLPLPPELRRPDMR
jgi:predicted enzyme related to lactoylglutathione lyase